MDRNQKVRDASLVILRVCSTVMDLKVAPVAVVVEDVAVEDVAVDVGEAVVEVVEILVEDVADRKSPAKIQEDVFYLPLMRNSGHCSCCLVVVDLGATRRSVDANADGNRFE